MADEIDITVTETSAGGGFVAVFPAGVTWPGNSSINWSAANRNLANGVITAVDSLDGSRSAAARRRPTS